MKNYLQTSLTQQHKKYQGNKKKKSTISTKLPYLPRSLSNNNRKQKITLKKQFDLRTNHMHLPKYNAQKDRNLIQFFQKPIIKRLVQKNKGIIASSKTVITEEYKNRLRGRKNLNLYSDKQVSRQQLLSYLQKAKSMLMKNKQNLQNQVQKNN